MVRDSFKIENYDRRKQEKSQSVQGEVLYDESQRIMRNQKCRTVSVQDFSMNSHGTLLAIEQQAFN